MANVPTVAHSEATPAGTDYIRDGDDRIREFKTQIREIVAVDHKFDSSGQGATWGMHKWITFIEAADIGTGASGLPILGAETAGGLPELVYKSETDQTVQLTQDGESIATETPDSSAPTADEDIANKKYVDAHGMVQVVNTQESAVDSTSTAMPDDDGIPTSGEGKEFMTLAITPTSATNKLRIDVVFQGSGQESGDVYVVALFQDSTSNALAAAATNEYGTPSRVPTVFTYYMAAGTTSATTFKVRAGCSEAKTLTFNGRAGSRKLGGVGYSSITITEIEV